MNIGDPAQDFDPFHHLAELEAEPTGLKQLTDEQIRTWSLEKKDRWWLKNVYRGNMPQLTLRSALTGMFLGGFLSLTNLYVGAKTGWTLGVGITSVVLSFALFKALSKFHLSKEMTVLENNAMQSIATAAGYMTAPLISSIAAYMMVTDTIVPMPMVMIWMSALSLLGVLFAFPLKKRFINDEQLPFPEGRAAGVVMEALHTGDPKDGVFKAKLLVITAGLSSVVTFLKSGPITEKLRIGFFHIPEYLDGWVYKFASPSIRGIELRNMTVRPDTDLVLMAAGGLMGIRTGVSLMFGAILNYLILVPWMIERGDIIGKMRDGLMTYSLKEITFWALWGGVAMMTTSALFSFFSKPKMIIDSFTQLFRKRAGDSKRDVLGNIELPLSVSFIGIPVVGAIVVYLGHMFFGISYFFGALAVPLVFVFSLIGVYSTGLTSITPGSALGKLTQITFSAIAPGNVTTNIMTAGITSEVTSNASNLLMDIKPGYMLGAKPRQQAIGHVLGIFAGAIVAVPVYYAVFLHNGPQNLITNDYPMPSATIWRAVAEVLTKGLSTLAPSAQIAAVIGGLAGILLEVARLVTRGTFLLSAVGIGLAFILPFSNCLTMFLGSLFFWCAEKYIKNKQSTSHRIFVENQDTTCAGLIAGGALMGIAVTLVEIFVLNG